MLTFFLSCIYTTVKPLELRTSGDKMHMGEGLARYYKGAPEVPAGVLTNYKMMGWSDSLDYDIPIKIASTTTHGLTPSKHTPCQKGSWVRGKIFKDLKNQQQNMKIRNSTRRACKLYSHDGAAATVKHFCRIPHLCLHIYWQEICFFGHQYCSYHQSA